MESRLPRPGSHVKISSGLVGQIHGLKCQTFRLLFRETSSVTSLPGQRFHIEIDFRRTPSVSTVEISPQKGTPLEIFPAARYQMSKGTSCVLRPTSLCFFPLFFLPGVLCDPPDLIWRKGTPFEATSLALSLSL